MLTKTAPYFNEQMLTIKQLSEFSGVGKRTIYQLVKTGRIPGFKFGGSWRFDRKILTKWMASEMKKNLTRK